MPIPLVADSLTPQLLAMTGDEILDVDPYIKDYVGVWRDRWADFCHMLRYVNADLGGMDKVSDYTTYGFFFEHKGKAYTLFEVEQILPLCGQRSEGELYLVYQEWAPNAEYLAVVGDFNYWDTHAHPAERLEFGLWRCRIPFYWDETQQRMHCPIHDRAKYKIYMELGADHKPAYRIPQHAIRAVHNGELGVLDPEFYCPEHPYQFKYPSPGHLREVIPRIYECHVGMSSEEPKINTYRDFADTLLPRIKEKGYNIIQIMAIQEHSYYGSFGYQVTSFFAPSSRYGTADDFKYLVDKAHELGIAVLLDLVHSHASKNVDDGIALWDGSDLYFYADDHPLWDSKVFNYKNPETLRFLLQNVRWWLQEFKIDGFRFDGVMSLMYFHRSAGVGYTGRYGEYFDEPQCAVDVGGMTYLRLAHLLIKLIEMTENRDILTIAEDVSGYPCMATPLLKTGIGFDYRFQMAVPDMWIKLMKQGFDIGLADEGIVDVMHIAHVLTNRRWQERHIVYCECHDQALVGDKTLSMWLLNENIYDNMSIFRCNDRTKRAIRLHKLIRLLTIGLGGEGYLAFFGNEFGHPEWLDFPREGNNWSYHYCRRLWNLDYWGKDGSTTRYADLGLFDQALMHLNEKYQWNKEREFVTRMDNVEKLLSFERSSLLFVVSIHPFNPPYPAIIPVRKQGKYEVIFHTNEPRHGGDGEGTQIGDVISSHNKLNKESNDLSADEWDAKMNGLIYYIRLWIRPQTGYVLRYLGEEGVAVPATGKTKDDIFPPEVEPEGKDDTK
ncbi:1,4-alpha-glucan branching enzyme [Giardia muris]|uniref:1,4-alpha-glucan branching enzyme n=1 Tax=Giardia muris TaxID=5742 RepID=A0A4Z1T1S1_GIAMU|nr:1,4-alpha-glucan branching enzyme [Giardia muris]|eukprot:TNJ29648.1 1,4-alpha-glucan branching enzyme [Giardia muris]